MRKILLILCCCINVLCLSQAQGRFVLSGNIRDSLNGKPLSGANVFVENLSSGCSSKENGNYVLYLDSGNYTLRISYIGYQTLIKNIWVKGNQRLNIRMCPREFEGKSVTVSGRRSRQNVDDNQMGRVELHVEDLKKMPSFFGETDVLKNVQLLPGIQSSGEGNSGFHVRGGGIDQNLILLDYTKLYNVGHLFGFFSVFNADAVQSADMMKGDIPAAYGGRLSSVLKISTPNGNDEHFNGKLGVGLIFSNFHIEGPLVKHKASFTLSGRRTYIDALIQPFLKEGSAMKGLKFYFYDFNGKISWKINPDNHLYFSAYNGADAYGFRTNGGLIESFFQWKNASAALQWLHFFNAKSTLNTHFSITDYDFATDMEMQIYQLFVRSGIRDYNFRTEFNRHIGEQQLDYGMEYTFHHFDPNNYKAMSGSTVMDFQEREPQYAHDAATFVSTSLNFGKHWKMTAGLRYSYFQHCGPYNQYLLNEVGQVTDTIPFGKGERVKDYMGLEPRISLLYAIDSNRSIKAAYNHCYQYVQQVSLSCVSLPTDAWIPSTESTLPQSCDQVSIGWFQNFLHNSLTASVEAYYKQMHHLTEYKAGYSPFNEAAYGYADPYTQGDGWSYGMECFIQKNQGRWKGWLGYTLSWSFRQFEQLNSGKVFCAKNDRRHDISLMMSYDILPQLTASAVWVYATGNTMTVPVGYYFMGYNLIVEYSGTNAYRLDPYHRLDFSLNWMFRKSEHAEHSLQLSVYNAYNRKNPFFISIQNSMNGNDMSKISLQSQAYQMSLFPILPSISYNVKFK